ncbi:ATP-grasp domain-containing protein [Alkalicoccobacillus porphyridii]|uniref:Alpha-L-glutamate ligase n=1 Tax=Alkalicoccobacillus porphyridii TaxID=2597270 RepID=A0A554A2F0_9BACI|nr:alpha-L-glutamate ligase [Alkalicoccobacillus porphyridii]TSB47871.1 alpha-L-glutamate ligase [Alkalicoccobacillus porphyridii]
MKKIYVIHENQEWSVHLFNRLEELGLPYEDWHLASGTIPLHEAPPEGIFYSRMSASAHTRDHRYAPELAAAVLSWLERHGRTVVNNSRALQLELSKVTQYMELERFGVRTPKTIAAVGYEQILQSADAFEGQPFITKHNRAGKGLGVRLFQNKPALEAYLKSDEFEEPVDGITLLQQYIEAPEPYITRCEFVGGQFVYAVRVNTSEGFELCPADACSIEDLFCPAGEEPQAKFQIDESFNDPVLESYAKVLEANGIQIAGIECIRDKEGNLYSYDINTNTNYNSEAEEKAGTYGMLEVAKYLGSLLKEEQPALV